MRTPENIEKQKVRDFLKSVSAYSFWPVQTGYGAATVDCLASVRGRFVGIEVKKKGYKPSDFTARQRVILAEIGATGGATFAGDADQIIAGLRAWLKI